MFNDLQIKKKKLLTTGLGMLLSLAHFTPVFAEPKLPDPEAISSLISLKSDSIKNNSITGSLNSAASSFNFTGLGSSLDQASNSSGNFLDSQFLASDQNGSQTLGSGSFSGMSTGSEFVSSGDSLGTWGKLNSKDGLGSGSLGSGRNSGPYGSGSYTSYLMGSGLSLSISNSYLDHSGSQTFGSNSGIALYGSNFEAFALGIVSLLAPDMVESGLSGGSYITIFPELISFGSPSLNSLINLGPKLLGGWDISKILAKPGGSGLFSADFIANSIEIFTNSVVIKPVPNSLKSLGGFTIKSGFAKWTSMPSMSTDYLLSPTLNSITSIYLRNFAPKSASSTVATASNVAQSLSLGSGSLLESVAAYSELYQSYIGLYKSIYSLPSLPTLGSSPSVTSLDGPMTGMLRVPSLVASNTEVLGSNSISSFKSSK